MRLGLTGGLGSGKSLVSRMLGELGAAVVDADELAREAVVPLTPAWQAIVDRFGRRFLLPGGALDRRLLGQLVFSDPEARRDLEAIVHPEVRRLMDERAQRLEEAGAPVVVLDIPLLFEAGLTGEVDKIAVVYAPPETQLARVMARDGLTEEEARRRIAAQWPLSVKAPLADYVIDNSGDREATRMQVQRLWEEITSDDPHCPGRS
ncbi:MAG: dephospho-CoA kinase [Chitinophagales bacterium]